MTAQDKLSVRISKKNHVCVGLDTDIKKIPRHLLGGPDPLLEFNKIIIENTVESAAAYKINFAFYEKNGSAGFDTIMRTLEIIPQEILTIADAKRGDIGNTSKMYAESVYDYFKFDSVTLHPYMGFDSISPFLEHSGKINFILALTSNSGSVDFEKQKLDDGKYLYQHVISKVNSWNSLNNCGLVFGATNTEELINNIDSFQKLPVLLPGVGAQGGSLEEVVKAFSSRSNSNFIINLSRALIYCDDSKSFGIKVNHKMKEFNSSIHSLLDS
ncbi:MAG: orotidine-5'-phosphate decarboxylase [Ignavibacteriae bacterium HGW-Ignavibacteriae-3]|nr:MAG: orotidine-5'-phosphate decarboxylase [Ignavibacteriae bacterium HGW-Ignavibacteriae-3]